MCDPLTIGLASFAISTVSGVAGYMGQMGQAEITNQLYEQNQENAATANHDKQRALNEQQTQVMASASAEKFDTSLEARSARATNAVAAGESGVQGVTIDGLMRDIYAQEGRANDRVDQNTDWTLGQIQADKKASNAQMVDRINSAPRGQKPSFLNLGLQIAGGGMDAYSTTAKLKADAKRSY